MRYFRRSMLNSHATILILALWILSFLAILALSLGAGVRQKMIFLSRIEKRNKLKVIATSGIIKAITVLNSDSILKEPLDQQKLKVDYHNNPTDFQHVDLKDGFFDILYLTDEGKGTHKRYGLLDENGKVNINLANEETLKELFKNVLGWDEIKASGLAKEIIDWREYGESEIVGFYSQSYYDNLQFPYPKKNSSFELLDELLQVKGMDERIFGQLRDYLTVYGQGKVNFNTAPRYVLTALGLNDDTIQKILSARQGVDGLDATKDDFIFTSVDSLVNDIDQRVKMNKEEAQQIQNLVDSQLLDVHSSYYSIRSQAELYSDGSQHTVVCVYNISNNKIEYWKEMN